MALYFTADLHLGHENIVIKNRQQFRDIDEMDAFILSKWNNKVGKDDEVYILGDLSFRAKGPVEYYLSALNGHKHLIVGNHDPSWMKHVQDLDHFFESIDYMKCLKHEKKLLTLCHYPMLEWPMSRYTESRNSFLLHGHIHNSVTSDAYHYIKTHLRTALNCGVDINDFEPATFEELILNNSKWYGWDAAEP